MAKEDDNIVEFHEPGGGELGLPWLPSHVLNDGFEACRESEEDDSHFYSKQRNVLCDEACGEDKHLFYSKLRNYNKHRHQPQPGGKSPAEVQPPLLPSPPHWKNISKPDQKPKHPTNWAAGGSGMQAVFLHSGQRSCGTGVFLPRTPQNDVKNPRKPAFAPVLLPYRVVQALNLKVDGLGLQIKPQDHNNSVKCLESDRLRSKKSRDVTSQICVISQSRNSSPEIFLPKEWTY